jgi:heat shock protein HslJ
VPSVTVSLALPGIVLGLVLGGCSLVEEQTDVQAEKLYGHTWIAEEVEGDPVPFGIKSSLVVDADGKVTGNGGCNGYFGSVIIDGGAMSFGNLGATRMACPEPAMSQEERLLRALDSTRGYRLQGGNLVLLDGAGAALVRFRTESGA